MQKKFNRLLTTSTKLYAMFLLGIVKIATQLIFSVPTFLCGRIKKTN